MAWEDILNDREFHKEPLSVRENVARNFFRTHIEADEGFKKEDIVTQLRVKSNFYSTLDPLVKLSEVQDKAPGISKSISPEAIPMPEKKPELPKTTKKETESFWSDYKSGLNIIRKNPQQALKDAVTHPIVDVPAGIVESVGMLATAPVGFVGGTVAGGGELLKGLMSRGGLTDEDFKAAREIQEQVMSALTYEPKTRFGQTVTEVAASPFTLIHESIEGAFQDSPEEKKDKYHFLADALLLVLPKFAKEASRVGKKFAKTKAAKERGVVTEAKPEVAPEAEAIEYKGPERRLTEEVGRLAEERRERQKKPTEPLKVIEPSEKPAAELRELQKAKGLRGKSEKEIKGIVEERTLNPLERAEKALKEGNKAEAIRLAKLSQEEGVILELADGPTTEKLVGKAADRAEDIIQKASKEVPAPEKPKLRVMRPEVKEKPPIAPSVKPEPILKPTKVKEKKAKPVSKEFHVITKEGEKISKENVLKSESGLIDIDKLSGEPTPKGKKVMELIRERRKDIDKTMLESEAFVQKLNKFSEKEREAISFIRQGIFNVDVLKKIGREDLIPVIRNPTKAMLKTSREVGQYFEAAHKFLKEYWDTGIGYKENYVTQIWDIPKGQVPKGFVTRNPFLQKRKIASFEEGIKLGLKPKTLDIAKIIRVYDQYRIQSAFNARFVDSIQRLTFLDEATGKAEPLAKRADLAPEDWVLIDHPALARTKAVGKPKGEGLILTRVPIKVHPEIAKEVKIIFDKPFSHPAIQAIETINAFAKKGQLSLSLFHHVALTEAALSSGIGLKALGLFWPPRIYNAIKRGDYEIYKKLDVSRDAIEHGVTFGALSDIQRGRINKSLESLENQFKDVPVARQLSKGIRKANEIWDKTLWDYYHNTLKLYAYEAQVLSEVKGLKSPTPEKITEIKKKTAFFVNDSFGGQNWDLSKTFGNPKMKQMMQLILLSPDWTISTLKQAWAPFKGAIKGDPVLLRRGGLFWLRAGLYFNLIVQSVNLYNTKKYLGEARPTWQNDPGHELNMFVGFNKDGTKKYLRMGKQFREVYEWGKDPLHKLGAKLSPTAREIMRWFTKSDPGSGFPTPWKDKGFWDSLPEHAKSVAEVPLPFSLRPYVNDRPTNFMFALPASKGMTNYKTRTLFSEALKRRDLKKVERIYFAALENNLDAESLFKSAKARIKADITYDNKKAARKIFDEIRDLDPVADRDAISHYAKRGMLTPGIIKELQKMFKTETSIQKQKQILKIKRKK